jgi:paraquat-inducible protein B
MKDLNPKLVGAFVIGAVILAVIGVVLFGSGDLFTRKRTFVTYFEGSVAGLNAGSPVKLRGVEIGKVTKVALRIGRAQVNKPLDEVLVPVVFEIDEKQLEEQGVESPLPDSVFTKLIDEGLRATLASESFVTGRKFISLDAHPGTTYQLVADPDVPYIEVPSTVTGLEELQRDVAEAVAKLAKMDIDTLVVAITEIMHGTNRLVNQRLPKTLNDIPETLRRMEVTMSSFQRLAATVDTSVVLLRGDVARMVDNSTTLRESIERTMGDLRLTIRPDAPALIQLEETLAALEKMSRSLQVLTDHLARNPSAVIRGKPVPEKP